jgi:hypothetical protein
MEEASLVTLGFMFATVASTAVVVDAIAAGRRSGAGGEHMVDVAAVVRTIPDPE